MHRVLAHRLAFVALLLGLFGPRLSGQGVITTLAGTEWVFPGDGRQAVNAPLGRGLGVAVDGSGNVFIADPENSVVMRVGANGVLTVVAGNGISGFSGDGGPATSASLSGDFPMGVAVDAAGNLYISDRNNNRVRRVTPGGIITTVAGNGQFRFAGDGGPAINAALDPFGLALDAAGNIYIADTFNDRIRKVTPDGIITTVAGNGQTGFSGDGGPATSAALNNPKGVAVDTAGNLYIADTDNKRIRKVTPAGIISTVAGNGESTYGLDGFPAVNSPLFGPYSVAVDAAGTLYIDDIVTVRKVGADGILMTAAGDPLKATRYGGDGGPAPKAALSGPFMLAVDAAGTLYIGEFFNMRVRRVGIDGIISTLAGNALFRSGGDGGPASLAPLYLPTGIALDRAGRLFIAENQRARVRAVAPPPGRAISTAAGTGLLGFPVVDNIPAVDAFIIFPSRVAVDTAGNLFISDEVDHRVRRVATNGIITTVAGTGQRGFSGDGGPATAASLDGPTGLAVDAAGILYIADTNNNRVRRVTPDGVISTFAGNGEFRFAGDGGPATRAAVDPNGLAMDAAGNLYIADTFNDRIRRVSREGIISTVAGSGQTGFSGDGGPALRASLRDPKGVFVDAAGNFYIADTNNHRIRRVTAAGTISTVAGSGVNGFSGDGNAATSAALNGPQDVAADAAGNIYIADTNNHRVRVVQAAAPSYRISSTSLTFTSAAGGTPSAAQNLELSGSVVGLPFSVTTSTGSGGDWLRVTPASGSMPATVQVVADPGRLAAGSYQGTLTFTAPNASPASQTVAVRFTVGQGIAAKAGTWPSSLAFSFIQQARPATQNLSVTNEGGTPLSFTATVETTSGGAWLAVAPGSASSSATAPASLSVTANPGRLEPGTYLGKVIITSSTTRERLEVPVAMTVSAAQQGIVLTQTGLSFTAVADGGSVPPQSFGVTNSGQGTMSWSASATTASGGSWLSITPSSGTSDPASAVPEVEVRVNAAGLRAGDYYGQIRVAAASANNSPQFVLVVLSVLPAGSAPEPLLQPTALIYSAAAGGASPGSQTVSVYNLTGKPTSFISGPLTSGGGNWLIHAPTRATVAPDRPTRIVVQPNTTGLQPGVQRGTLTFQFEDGTPLTVRVLLVVAPGGGASVQSARRADGPCQPTKLLPEITSLSNNSSLPAGWPSTLEVKVVDDCGAPMSNGTVAAEFTNLDKAVVLKSLNDGRWRGDWKPQKVQPRVTITVKAVIPKEIREPQLEGQSALTVGVQANPNPPAIGPGAVVSAASFRPASETPPAPGSWISIFGSKLADSLTVAGSAPLPTELATTTVAMGGRALPLLFASEGQVNAMVPYDIPINTNHQILVRRGSAFTSEPVLVAAAQPAIFTKSQDGRGQGVIVDVNNRYVEPGNATKAGDAIIIYCAGLGAVDPPVAAGDAAPFSPLSQTVNPVTLTVGGVEAKVFFSGLAPGFVGLYQVNAFVPEGVAAADDVPVVLSVAGQKSPPVTIAVR